MALVLKFSQRGVTIDSNLTPENINQRVRGIITYWPERNRLTWQCSNPKDYPNSRKVRTLKQLDEFFEFLKTDGKRFVKLNDEYTAEVTKTHVIVGCQEFPHSVVRKLYEALAQ